jgi:hypothetical protein
MSSIQTIFRLRTLRTRIFALKSTPVKTFCALIVVLLHEASKVVSGHDKQSPRQSRVKLFRLLACLM